MKIEYKVQSGLSEDNRTAFVTFTFRSAWEQQIFKGLSVNILNQMNEMIEAQQRIDMLPEEAKKW